MELSLSTGPILRKIFIIGLFLALCHSLCEAGQEIVAIQGIRVNPYETAMRGFKSVCTTNIKRLVLSELGKIDVAERIEKIGPEMVLAIGKDALEKAKKIRRIPVVYVMVLSPQLILSDERNITGVSMNIAQERQLAIIQKALPHVRTVGLLYDPLKTTHLVTSAKSAATRFGINLVANEVRSSSDIPRAIRNLGGKIDLFWMLPDTTVITPETTELIFLFSLERKIPVVTFSEKYLSFGRCCQ